MQHEQRNNQHLGVGQRWWQKEAAKVQAARPNAARGAPWAGPEVAFERVRAAARRLEEAYRVANFGRALGNSSAQTEERKAGLANGDGGHGVQQFRTTRKQVYELHAYETDPKPRISE